MNDESHKYSEEELQRTLTKEILKFQLAALTRDVDILKQTNAKDLTEIKAQISQVINMIKDQTDKQEENRKEFKKEIEAEFASKIDLERLENKLDKMFLKITVTVGTIVSVAMLIEWALSVANGFKSLAG